jgi:hypothetical protein
MRKKRRKVALEALGGSRWVAILSHCVVRVPHRVALGKSPRKMKGPPALRWSGKETRRSTPRAAQGKRSAPKVLQRASTSSRSEMRGGLRTQLRNFQRKGVSLRAK